MPSKLQLVSLSNAAPPFFVGVDLGGTNIKVGLVDNRGQAVCRFHIPTEVEQGPEEGARRMGQAVKRAIREAGVEPGDVAGVGFCTPGTMDIPRGMLLQPHNLPGWYDFPIRDRVSHYSGIKVTFANDAGAAAYGEYWVGRGSDFHSMVLLTLGTGVGGGIIIGDLSVDGENSHGAECGHIIIDYTETARRCGCGQLGHLEAYASATAVIARAGEQLKSAPATSVAARVASGEELTPLLLAEEAENGDAFALQIILETAKYLGIGIVSLMHTIDPGGVVLGGAMTFGGAETQLGQRFLQRVRQEISARAFPVLAQRTVIDFAQLAGDAGFIGAAGLARRDYLAK